MYELVQVGPQSYYLQSPAKIGLYTPDAQHAILIDSGNDKDAGRKALKVLNAQGWTLTAIVNTHSNADHIGGNQYLQSQTGCAVFANGMELAFTRHPVLEPAFLYDGFPNKDLQHKFLLAQESDALPFTDDRFPKGLQVIPLPGHFLDMVGFRTPDDTVFLADCLSSEATLTKYGIPFIYDVAAFLTTLDTVEAMRARAFVPSHAEATDDIRALAAYNRAAVLAIGDALVSVCHTPTTFEKVLQAMFERYQLQMNMEQYVLVGSTVRSFLMWLKDSGRLACQFVNSQMLWQAV